MAYIIKLESGRVKLYEKSSFKRSIGNNVTSASCDDEWVVCVENGRVKQYTAKNGSLKRSIGETGAVDVQLSGDMIIISYANGKTKAYKIANGSFIRSL